MLTFTMNEEHKELKFSRHIDDKANLSEHDFDESTTGNFKVHFPKLTSEIMNRAVCWMVSLKHEKHYELLDKLEQTIYIGRIAIKHGAGKRKLTNCRLNITLKINGKHTSKQLPRHSADKEDLVANGFHKSTVKNVKVYTPLKIELTYTILKKAICWRIHPKNLGYFQLIDAKGLIIYTGLIKTKRNGVRKLRHGNLALNCRNNEAKRFFRKLKRHPGDSLGLTANGFVSAHPPIILSVSDAPTVIEDAARHDLEGNMPHDLSAMEIDEAIDFLDGISE